MPKIRCVFVIATMLLVPLYAFADGSKPSFHDCTFLGHFGKIILVSYCPATTPPEEVETFVQATKNIWLAKYGFVQYRIFSTKEDVPMSMSEFMAKPDPWFEKYELAHALYNNATGHKDFFCRKTPSAKLSDCSYLLK